MISAERIDRLVDDLLIASTFHKLEVPQRNNDGETMKAAAMMLQTLLAERRAQGLSQEDREACLRAAVMNDQRASLHSSLKYGDEPEAKPFRDDAAILRRLGGQTI